MLLTCIFALLSALQTGIAYWQNPTLSLWWIAPLWLAGFVLLCVAYLLVVVGCFRLLTPKAPTHKNYRVYRPIITATLRWLLILLGVRHTLTGGERIPTDRPFLLVSNHRSAFDPLVILANVKQSGIAFVAKPGVFNIPVIGAIMRRLCFLPINRESARAAVTTIKTAGSLIKETPQIAVGIFPEGTRSRDGALLPFHAGSFKIAKLADCPVVVIALKMEKGALGLPRRMDLQVVDVMDAAFVAENKTDVLCDRALDAIRTAVE